MFRREGQPGSRSPLNQPGPGSETSDESATFNHCIPELLPFVAGLGWGDCWGILGSYTINLGFIKNKRSRGQGNHDFLKNRSCSSAHPLRSGTAGTLGGVCCFLFHIWSGFLLQL